MGILGGMLRLSHSSLALACTLSLPLALLAGCQSEPVTASPAGAQAAQEAGVFLPDDIHSLSRPNEVRVTHVDLDLQLDFESQRLIGEARLELRRFDREAPLLLDTQALRISAVLGEDGRLREYDLGPSQGRLGQALRIQLEPSDEAVYVRYSTTSEGEALQWLAPEQTAGGEQPFLFTQGQAILTRSWIPLQDSPGVRVTYSARINCPAGLTPVMSANGLGPITAGVPEGRSMHAFCARPADPQLPDRAGGGGSGEG